MNAEVMGTPLGPDEVAWDLSDRLRKAREACGLEQTELAERMQVTRQTIGNYENRRVKPNRGTIVLWALATGVPIDWLWRGVWPDDDDEVTRGYVARAS